MCLTTANHFPNKYRGDRSTIMTKTSKTNICLFVTFSKESSSDTLIFLHLQMFCYLINSFPGTFTLSQYVVDVCAHCVISPMISVFNEVKFFIHY